MIPGVGNKIIIPYDLKTGLISCWEFDETSGTDAFDAHGSDDGINVGATINQAGKLDRSYSYDGFDDYINISYNELNSSFAISAWVKIPHSTGEFENQSIISIGGVWVFKRRSGLDNALGVVCETHVDALSNTAIADDVWEHIIVSYDGTTLKLYQNNIETYSATETFNFTQRNDSEIGRRYYTSGSTKYYLEGNLDQIAVWSRALTTDEISALYNSGDGLAYTNW